MKVKRIKNKEIIMAITMAKIIITVIMTIINNNDENENQKW